MGERWPFFVVLLFISLELSTFSNVYWFVKSFFKVLASLWHSSFHVPETRKGSIPFVLWVCHGRTHFQLEYRLILLNWTTVVFPFGLCCVDTNCNPALSDAVSSWPVSRLQEEPRARGCHISFSHTKHKVLLEGGSPDTHSLHNTAKFKPVLHFTG